MPIILVLAVLILATPAFAGVTVAVVPIPDTNSANVTYALTGGEATMGVRAFALSLTVTAGDANIIACDPNKTDGESTSAYPGYGIFIGSIQINESGVPTSYGTPVAQADDPDTPGQLGTQSIIIELGSLYDNDTPADAPDASGTLVTITLDGCDATVTPAVDSLRGGIVMEDPDTAATGVVMTPGDVECAGGPEDCMAVDDVIGDVTVTQTIWDLWDSINKPDVWCCVRRSKGDADGDGFTTASDVTPILTYFQQATSETSAHADLDRDGFITASDVTPILNNFQTGSTSEVCPPLP